MEDGRSQQLGCVMGKCSVVCGGGGGQSDDSEWWSGEVRTDRP